jgi:hypothetical protein
MQIGISGSQDTWHHKRPVLGDGDFGLLESH